MLYPIEDDFHVEAAVIQRVADLCTDELLYQFITDAVEILTSNGVDASKLDRMAQEAFDIEDVETRIELLDEYTFKAEQMLASEDYRCVWADGYVIGRDV